MNNIITINREFGSGGREVAIRLAKSLGYKYYDRALLHQLVKQSNFDETYIENVIKNSNDDFPYTISKSFSLYSAPQKQATDVLVLEQKIIKQLAEKSNCVFVGRGADVILNDLDPLNIFVYATMESKVARCKAKASKEEKLTDREIIKNIKAIDKERKKHSLLLGSDAWDEKENYDLCINTSYVEIKSIIPAIESFAKAYFKEVK